MSLDILKTVLPEAVFSNLGDNGYSEGRDSVEGYAASIVFWKAATEDSKKRYARVKYALDKAVSRLPGSSKVGRIGEAANGATASAFYENFGFAYILVIEGIEYDVSITRFVNSASVELAVTAR